MNRRHHANSNERGFTLVELLVVMIITVLLSGVIMGFVVDQLRSGVIDSAKQQLLAQAELGLDYTAKDIRLSANADANNRWPDANAPDPADQYSWQSGSDTLVLATGAQDSSGNILFTDPSKYITAKDNHVYFLSNGTLYRRILASPASGNAAATTCPSDSASSSCPADKVVLSDVSSFSVTYIDSSGQPVTPTSARSILLSVTLDSKAYGEDITASYSTQMVFRNDS